MKTLFLHFVLALCCLGAAAQSDAEFVQLAERQEAELNEHGAFENFRKALNINPSNHTALWKLSELCSRIGKRQATKQQQQEFYVYGKSYAQRAIQVAPTAADGYYVLAVSMGRLALAQSGKERVRSVKEIRTLIEKALALHPRHGRAWHVLGKWHYEVSNLGIFEKAALKVAYGGLPPASLKESIAAYERAKVYEPAFALNFLELAKAYHRNDNDEKAFEQLRALPAVPNKTLDDARIKSEGARLLKEWSE
ncbi:hypothetical protein [Flaviaesturariibacter amylovorans]|uniref:Regulator of microtubule dynamics protein 1 n=1 Tax=Flaviaesturariibacter amylovorans TaxID=1084520 RepID=A0ABP8GWG4_9BACT